MATNSPFIWAAGGRKLTPQEAAARREIENAILEKGIDFSPVADPFQGLGRVANAAAGAFRRSRLGADEADITSRNKALVSPILAALTGGSTATAPSSIPMTSAAGEVAATAPGSTTATPSGVLPASFLGVVDTTEGGGGYDTLYGHAQRGKFAGTDVSAMPIRDVIAFTDPSGPYAQSVKSQIGRVATPVGRHQIVGTTLRNAVSELGLDLNTPFNAETQDRIALHLAKNRLASADTLPGKISALRNEWEGFKNVSDEQLAQVVADIENAPMQVASATPMTASDAIESVAPLQPVTDPAMSGQAPVSLSDEVAAYQQTPEYAAAFPGRQAAPPLDAPVSVPTQPVAGVPMQSAPVQVAGGGDRVPMAAPSINPAIIEALTDPQATPQTQMLARIVLEQQQRQAQAAEEQRLQAADPLRQLQIQKAQRDLNATNIPDSVQALNIRAQQAGLQPGTPEYQKFMLSGGDRGITINNEGTIPAGYQAVRDPEGRVTAIQPIPGSPAALEMEQALKARDTQGGRKQTSTDVITNAASNARELIKSGTLTTGTLGRIASNLTESDAAELRRQVDVLKSNATIENLTAMRQASPTGGALGSVTEKEGAMLAAAAGAIDPNAGNEQVAKQLDNYEKTLLRVIHGPKVGDAIFEQTRQQKPISEMTDEELEALANGD